MDESSRKYARALARAFAGAIIFAIPIMMTMETWALGGYMDRFRLGAFMVFVLPLLVGLAHVSGFEPTRGVLEPVMDAVTAYLVALVAASLILLLFGVIGPGMSMDEVVGKLVLQASAGSFGAILATSTLSGGEDEAEAGEDADGADAGGRGASGESGGSGDEAERRLGYGAELLLMCAGALFLALNIAPTEEIAQIAARMGPWLVFMLMAVSIAAMHAFVYAVEFRGQEAIPAGTPMWSIVLRFTVVGYALSLLIAGYVLWCFGRLDGLGPTSMAMRVAVLAFPAAIGAASARLVL